MKSQLRADSFGFFDRFSCLGLILEEYYAQFPVLCLWVSMDALAVSRSLRALLAFGQSSIASNGGVMLLVLETVAIGEMLAGMSSREVSATSALALDEVSTGQDGTSGF